MAAANLAKMLQGEMTCPLCLECLNDPVSLDCDHSFCRACITQCWGELATDVSCPLCRQTFPRGKLRLNRQLRNIVDATRELLLQSGREPAAERLCEKHREPLKLFCKEDEIPICLVCDRSKGHRDHTVIPAEDAAKEFQVRLQAHLKTLRAKRETLLGLKVSREKRSQEYLKQTQAERQMIVAEFQQLRQFLEEQERLLLAQLEKLDEEIGRLQTDNVGKLSEQISHLSELIGELEGKCQKPASEFLQDVRSTLSRCEIGPVQLPEEISPELGERVRGFSRQTTALSETLREFTGSAQVDETALRQLRLCYNENPTVTLDPDTAHPSLVLSEDRKHVSWELTRQPLPDNPERFDPVLCVLGREGFTSGRHCWEVVMGDGPCWAVGVARESVSRKGGISLRPEGGIWAVQRWEGQFQALTSPVTPLSLSPPRRIRVCLDCDRGQVTFIDAGAEAPIFAFPPGSFPGKRIRPWLWVGRGSPLSLCP
uniref:Zinc finger protein RFP-like n=1 Tax=Pelodiscus sinensis TaxID=13735 RepID=K7FIS3_PELSI